MMYIYLLSLLLASTAIGKEETRMNCNWAQQFTDFDKLLANNSMQEEVMLMASEWEGKFAEIDVGIDSLSMTTYQFVEIDPDTGTVKAQNATLGRIVIQNEALQLAILAQALSGSQYARKFLEINVVKGHCTLRHNCSIDEMAVRILQNKYGNYRRYRFKYNFLGGIMNDVMTRISSNIFPLSEPKKLNANLVGYLGWSLIASGVALKNVHMICSPICFQSGLLFIEYAKRLATHALIAFYDRDTGKLYAEADYNCTEILGGNYIGSMRPNTSSGAMGNYDEEMTAYFVYLVADWSNFGGEDARRAFWTSRRQFMEKAELETPHGPITVQRGVYYASWERIGHLFLPFFDVEIVERLFINGERARMYFSAMNRYPGLFSSVEAMNDDSSEWYQALGIKALASSNISTYEIVTPHAAFPALLHNTTRAYGLAWYLAMLQGSKMQGPLGSSDSYRTGDLVPSKLSWSKAAAIIAFGGGIGPLVRSYLKKNKLYEDFKATVEAEYGHVFQELKGENVPFTLPTAVTSTCGSRFRACSDEGYNDASCVSDDKPVTLPIAAFALFCVSIIILARRRKIMILRQYNGDIQLPAYGHRARGDLDGWEIAAEDLIVFVNQKLGSGAFASVYKGALGKLPAIAARQRKFAIATESMNDVAVKMPLAMASDQRKEEFLDEIRFMKNLGYHAHLLNMLGCVSDPRNPILVVELCEHGDLLRVLRNNKLRPKQNEVETSNAENSAAESTLQLEHFDRISIAWQISDAMEYLSARNCIHRDLAARNVLLTGHIVAKIADFGLCRTGGQDGYTSRGGLLPFKWMAPESLQYMEFSSKSDVWSYGVLLYEIFSNGATPYATVQQNEMIDHLESGNRLPQPVLADDIIYNVMQSCWIADRNQRPSFGELHNSLIGIIETHQKTYGYMQATEKNQIEYAKMKL